MKVKPVYVVQTLRSYVHHPSYDIVYEWEDELNRCLNVNLKSIKKVHFYFHKVLKKINIPIFNLKNDALEFCFEMNTDEHLFFNNRTNVIPCIIDFYNKIEAIDQLNNLYSKNPCVLISSLEVYEYLIMNNLKKKIFHFPLSLPDKYKTLLSNGFEKKYDLVLMGRQNEVLEGFFKKYCVEHKNITYVHRVQKDGKYLYYTNIGECLGDINTREKYMNLMSQSKVGLYATPGIDGDEIRTNGFSQITPRFLEYVSCGCHIIARYNENSDAKFYEIETFSPSIQTYEQFESNLDYALKNEINKTKYSNYLHKHYTSNRAELLKSIILSL
jgi:hypothetical protein